MRVLGENGFCLLIVLLKLDMQGYVLVILRMRTLDESNWSPIRVIGTQLEYLVPNPKPVRAVIAADTAATMSQNCDIVAAML